eukprot:8657101-Alexandrium_andersonii.AAC.1
MAGHCRAGRGRRAGRPSALCEAQCHGLRVQVVLREEVAALGQLVDEGAPGGAGPHSLEVAALHLAGEDLLGLAGQHIRQPVVVGAHVQGVRREGVGDLEADQQAQHGAGMCCLLYTSDAADDM